MKRTIWWMLALSVALSLAALAAIAATPPNLPKALAAQRQLAAQRPQDAGVQNDLGNLLLLARQPAEAEAAYRRALELDPKRTSALFNLGLLEEDRGDSKGARELFERVVQNEPQHAWAHYELGSIAEAAGRRQAAVGEYSRAFALNPQLAFPDVNPHVVGSKLMTESLLRAYRQTAVPPQAPKAYEQPSRIASILVGTPPANADETAAAGANPPLVRQPPVAGTARPGTVIREGNLPRGDNTGQALPPGTAKRPDATANGAAGGYRPGQTNPAGRFGATRTWPRPDPNLPNSNLDADEETEVPVNQQPIQPQINPPPGVVVAPPSGNSYYQPRLGSSGRLEIRLLGATEPAVRAAG